MPTVCRPLVRGLRLRVTRVDPECGDLVEGECSTVVSGGFVSVAMTDNFEAPTVASQMNAAGVFCYYDETTPQLTNITSVITFCDVDPDLFEITTGSPLVVDGAGNAVGFDTDHTTYATGNYALEIWSKVPPGINDPACPPGGLPYYGYFLLPWQKNGTFTAPTIENGAVNFAVTSTSQRGTPWGVGPYDVMLDALGDPSPLLDPVSVANHRRFMFTQLAPPEPMCGCQPLVIESP